MSRLAKPRPNGEPPVHRIQVHTDDVEWLKATKAAKANGLLTVASLCRVLLNREFERLEITDELVRREEKEKAASKRTGKKAKPA